VAEWEDRGQIQLLATQVGQQVKCEELHQIARSAPPMEQTAAPVAPLEKCVRIGVAQDKSFSFYYPESLAVLEALGAQLVPFSPLADKDLPQVDGLVFGGGFPEMFLSQLAANGDMQAAIRRVAAQGMPIYAECGGMMYLARQLITTAGQSYPMVGLVPGVCQMQAKLQAVGYVEATALGDNILCYQGDKLHGHEFHFSTLLPDEDNLADEAFQFITVNNADCYLGGYFTSNLLASYLHIHFAGNKQAAQRLIQLCSNYRTKGS
jgi:cobyrinic acid a,c-diamide synthase